jgi:hypothetical protein
MQTRLWAAAAAILTGCTGAAPTAPSGSVDHDGIRYSATTVIVDSAAGHVRTTLTLQNVSDGPRTVQVGGCRFFVRVYATETHTPPPIYDQSEKEACPEIVLNLTLGLGQSWTASDDVTGHDVLGDTAPPGLYAFVAVVPSSSGPLTIDAGSAPLYP